MRRTLAFLLLAGALAAVVALYLSERWRRAPVPGVLAELPDFALVDGGGRPVGRADLAGRPWIADFIFTRCAVYCPRLTARMKELAGRLGPGSEARLVSISVDPEHDRPAVLADYARKWQLPERPEWLFLTGEKAAVRELIRAGFLLPVEDAPENVAMPILHSNRFVLVDDRGRIRATYDAFEPDALDRLLADLDSLRAGRAER